MVAQPTVGSIFAVVMAAGLSKRFGATKQLATIDGVPLVRRALDNAHLACGMNTALVLGHDWRAVSVACAPMRGFLIYNDDYAGGLGTSIAQAARSLRHVAQAIVVMLADQPRVTAEHVRAICGAWSGDADEIVATTFNGTHGPPVLFPRGCFDELAALEGDQGARQLLDSDRYRVTSIDFPDAAIDIDRREDLLTLT